MRVNGVSTTFRHASWKIWWQCGDIDTKSNCRPSFYAKMLYTTSLPCPENGHQRSVNDLRPSILENQWALRPRWSIIVLSCSFLGKYAYDTIVTISQNVRQCSINNLCAGIVNNLTGMERRSTTMNQLAAFVGNNASDDIASTCYNWAPTVRQGSERYTAINCIMLYLNAVSCGQSLQSVLEFNFTNMHAMSHWSDHFPSRSRVNI